MIYRAILIASLLVASMFPPDASANEAWRVVFDMDNDVIVGEDRHYTNGLFLSLIAPQDRVPMWIRKAAFVLNPFDAPENHDDRSAPTDVRWSVALGQEMYTPENSALRVRNPSDRRYAGYLYARFELARDRHRDVGGKIPYLDLIQLDSGVVGPAALARQGQDLIHEITFSPKFQGWDTQLNNEFAFNARRSRHWRIPGEPIALGESIGLDAIAGLIVEAGTVKTAGTGALMLRAGWRLPADFGRGRFAPRDDAATGFRLYAFVGGEVSGVAHNVFLDGVDEKNFVVRVPVGAGFQYGRFRSLLTVIWNSKEFDGQDGADIYGRWSIIVDI